MSDPHSEKDGTIEVTIGVEEFNEEFYQRMNEGRMRIYLGQSSPIWKEWELRDIEFIGVSPQAYRRRGSRKSAPSSSAWPPVGSAGSSLRNKLSSPTPVGNEEEESDLWEGNNLPGAVLDKLARKISDQMAMLRGRDRLMRSQGAAFLEVQDVEREVEKIKEEIKEEGGGRRKGGGTVKEKR
ncbi:hypothetical protein TrST_g8239 [Triparma strigata]|uniref:Uncharacterized protein n=1 Tax=Triparma strigata TaxID=1606541 RepID=A0A9W7DRU9_9STRA|nr:hypothetical protein TrST_g8239 [Triparma strigata]